MYEIILASGSPRRSEILDQVGVKYHVIKSEKEEHMADVEPYVLVQQLAAMKAEDVAEKLKGSVVILGADTVVAYQGNILGKPKDEQDAKEMLHNLAGNSHEVYTGVCIIVKEKDQSLRMKQFFVVTKVFIGEMSKEQITEYVESKEPMDKAGAYAIQGKFASFVERIEGDYYNIIGFPICKIMKEAYKMGVDLKTGEKLI